MARQKSPKAWIAYRLGRVASGWASFYGETEEEALENAQKKSPRPRPRRSASKRSQ
jgi:hypothetical protein